MFCRRLAKQHGSETRADQPAAGGHVFPSASRPALPRRQADRVRTGGPCFFTVRPRARTARQTVGTLAGTTFCPRPPLSAQRRPERQPRRHSTMIGHGSCTICAQRRPERQPRRHPRQKVCIHCATVAQRRPERQPRRHLWALGRLNSEVRAQRRPERQPRRHVAADASCELHRARSTKAGASTPATPGTSAHRRQRPGPLNEGRSVNPGDTAKFCKGAVSGQTIARPRAREPRRRRVCGHFTRFWTIPRQNGQDQASRLP